MKLHNFEGHSFSAAVSARQPEPVFPCKAEDPACGKGKCERQFQAKGQRARGCRSVTRSGPRKTVWRGKIKQAQSLWQTGQAKGKRKANKGNKIREEQAWCFAFSKGSSHSGPAPLPPPSSPSLQRPMCLRYKARASVLETEESGKRAELGKARVFSSKAMVQAMNRQKCTNPAGSQKGAFLKKNVQNICRENRVPGPQRHCQWILAGVATLGDSETGNPDQPEKAPPESVGF